MLLYVLAFGTMEYHLYGSVSTWLYKWCPFFFGLGIGFIRCMIYGKVNWSSSSLHSHSQPLLTLGLSPWERGFLGDTQAVLGWTGGELVEGVGTSWSRGPRTPLYVWAWCMTRRLQDYRETSKNNRVFMWAQPDLGFIHVRLSMFYPPHGFHPLTHSRTHLHASCVQHSEPLVCYQGGFHWTSGQTTFLKSFPMEEG